MFAQLLASRPARRRSPAGFAASLIVHGLTVGGALVLTSRMTQPPARTADPTVRLLITEPTRAPKPVAVQHPGPMNIRVNVISVPIDVPNGLPPIDLLRPALSPDDPMVFRIGAPPTRIEPSGSLDVTTDFAAQDVEFPVVVDPRSPLPRYPQWLRDAGVEGSVRARFVVDTLGRVDLTSVQVLNSTHAAFAEAMRLTLPQMRFVPARIGTRRVRQLVEFPLEFRLNR